MPPPIACALPARQQVWKTKKTSKFGEQKVAPSEAFYSAEMGEFFLKYEDVQKSSDPEKMLFDFLQTSYEAAVNISNWNRIKLEKQS